MILLWLRVGLVIKKILAGLAGSLPARVLRGLSQPGLNHLVTSRIIATLTQETHHRLKLNKPRVCRRPVGRKRLVTSRIIETPTTP
jgi:hypothetical protein